MRVLSFLTALGLPLLAAATTRQRYHPLTTRGSLLDTCLTISLSAIVDKLDILGLLGVLNLDLGANICICLSTLTIDINANAELKALEDLVGANVLASVLIDLLDKDPSCQQCTYTTGASPSCTASNPCAFNCTAPYIKSGDTCVCGATLCNGVCGSFPHGCPSAAPYGKRNAHLPHEARVAGVTSYAQAKRSCEVHESVCGVYGGRSLGYECLDTARDLENCGGCTIPHPFVEYGRSANGTDCTALPEVLDVSCEVGRCAVRRCRSGYHVSSDGTLCEPDAQTASFVWQQRQGDAIVL
ncbi:hypothetical protein PENSPDRAFT_388060 [Peniophora sp. CONT]|nr:hypothetical protein PENSPDRAFT_388060 [Peniophora sp. CONT]